MKVYCAGKTQDYRGVEQVQALVRHTGHEITHNWVEIIKREGGDVSEVPIPEDRRQQYATWDMEGVRACELLIAKGYPKLSGTLWECGAAAVLGKSVWLLDWHEYGRVSVFEDLPNVERVTIQEVGERLWAASQDREGSEGRLRYVP